MASTHGNGSIVQLEKDKPKGKCRKWRLVVSLGRDPRTGKYPQKAKAFHGTYTEAQKALREFADQIQNGNVVKKSSWTFNEYAEYFVKQRIASGELAERTTRADRDRLHCIGFVIGELNLQDVTTKVLDSAYLDLREGKSRSGRPISRTTIRHTNKTVSLMMDSAKAQGLIGANPCKDTMKYSPDTPEKKAMEEACIKELLGKLRPEEPYELAIILCLTLGLRRCETLGLSWGDVDFANNTIYVHHSVNDDGSLKTTKTKAGIRLLPLPSKTRNALMARLERIEAQQEERNPVTLVENEGVFMLPDSEVALGAGATRVALKNSDPIVCDEWGVRIRPALLSTWWHHNRKNFGADGWTLHELRHTFLTQAAKQGVHPSVMQKLAGHEHSNITTEIYTHVNLEDKQAAMAQLQSVFG